MILTCSQLSEDSSGLAYGDEQAIIPLPKYVRVCFREQSSTSFHSPSSTVHSERQFSFQLLHGAWGLRARWGSSSCGGFDLKSRDLQAFSRCLQGFPQCPIDQESWSRRQDPTRWLASSGSVLVKMIHLLLKPSLTFVFPTVHLLHHFLCFYYLIEAIF